MVGRHFSYLGPVDGIGEVPVGRGKQVTAFGYFPARLE